MSESTRAKSKNFRTTQDDRDRIDRIRQRITEISGIPPTDTDIIRQGLMVLELHWEQKRAAKPKRN